MGTMNYASSTEPIELDDRLLAHVRTVALTKLRRGESFALTIPEHEKTSATLWINASIPLRFDVSDEIALDRELLTAMMAEASSSRGLDLTGPVLSGELPRAPRLRAMSA
ncbi:hypothetical protein [Microbacterium sp. K24]|uniref:DUF7882 family protein n=1 Tax=Microbacterium sp. K24 TaxID=2305446 RepID=UPI00109CCB45|nr:hypothetical protein [Microbacterium sp. K24]